MPKFVPLWAWRKPIVGQSVGRGIGSWVVLFTGLAWPNFGLGVTTIISHPWSKPKSSKEISTGNSISDDPVKD